MSEPLVIVGNGMAAARLVDELTRCAPAGSRPRQRLLRVSIGELSNRAYHAGETYAVGDITTGPGSTRASSNHGLLLDATPHQARRSAAIGGSSNLAGSPAPRDAEAEFLACECRSRWLRQRSATGIRR